MDKKVEEYLGHFSKDLSQEIIDYATNIMLLESRYIFVTTVKKQQYGYCTHCHSEFKTHISKPTIKQAFEMEQCGCHAAIYAQAEYEKQRHGQKMECPVCKSICTVRYSGLGHSRLLDSAYFVYYEKSILDPKVIVARGITAIRDYTVGYKDIKTVLYTDYYYIFEYNKGGKMIKYINRWYSPSGWGFAKTVYSRLYNQAPSTKVAIARDSIKTAIKNTPFAWSGWEQHNYKDMVEFFDLFARYPVVEYLNKLGFKKLIEDKLKGDNTHKAINWRGKTLLKVLRLTEEEYQVIKQQKIILSFWFLHLLKINREQQLGLNVPEVKQLSEMIYGLGELDSIRNMTSKNFTFRDAVKYIIKQIRKSSRSYYGASSVARDWLDYKAECKTLNMDISDTKVLYPNDLHAAHQNTAAQIRYAEDKALSDKIKLRLPQLSRYNFSKDGLVIRPAESAFELVEEGKALSHCVGRYSKDYAEGKTDILVIRKETKQDKPYYTMEVKDNKIVQTRGRSNCLPDKIVSEFVKAFEQSKLQKAKPKKNNKLAVPA